MNNQPKVSVIMPSLNVAQYIRECMESVVNQTLKDIEIICVDAGSTDGTLEILQEYADKDARIKLIHSDKKSYGHQMNLGMDAATGEYMGIVETDDFIVEDAYEKLYRIAKNADADVVKGNYYEITTCDGQKTYNPVKLTPVKERYNRSIDPKCEPWVFYIPMMNVLGIFKLKYIQDEIRFNETPGASHQDMGFWFQAFAIAKRIFLVDEEYYCYRIDNPNSSINNNTKVFCVSDEYNFIRNFLERDPKLFQQFAPVYYHRMFGSYYFTFNKLARHLKPLFLIDAFQKDYLDAQKSEFYTEERFSINEKKILRQVICDPYSLLSDNMLNELKILDESLALANKKIEELSQDRLSRRTNTASDEEKQNTIKVSVIIPVYNTGSYLKDCLTSIRRQSLKEIEIICINDGSTDESSEILRNAELEDARIHVFNNSINMGQSYSRNKALSYACGKYIYCMDSDDTLDLNALEYLFSEAEKENLDVLYFDADVIYDNSELKEKYPHMHNTYQRSNDYSEVYTGNELLEKLQKNKEYRVSPCLQFIRHSLLIENNISFFEGIIYEDNLFALEVILCAKRASHRKRTLFHRRIRKDSTTTSNYTFKSFYGYLVCYIQMYALQIKYEKNDQVFNVIENERNGVKKASRRIYGLLEPKEKNKLQTLSLTEKRLVLEIISNETVVLDKGMKPKDTYDMGRAAILEAKLAAAKKEISDIRASKTFKIGVIITYVPKKIRGVYRCYKEHGAKYTFKEIQKTIMGKNK